MSEKKKPVRVLHIVGSLNRGGAETWLMNVLRNLDRDCIQFDFAVESENIGAYDSEVQALGSRVIHLGSTRNPFRYGRRLRHALSRFGPYDVVHSHVHHFSGYVLALARSCAVPVRIAHSHSNTTALQQSSNRLRRAYFGLMRQLILSCSTIGLAVSTGAASALFGPTWDQDSRFRVLYCGIDLSSFTGSTVGSSLYSEFGLPSSAFVVGHVGRFTAVKNHHFIVEVARKVCRENQSIRFLLVGDGELRQQIEEEIKAAGLEGKVIIAGLRTDVPALMMNLLDILILPSFYEGLPIVGVEAQASGLPTLFSNAITPEVEVIPQLVDFLPLDVEQWSQWILKASRSTSHLRSTEAVATVANSPFNVERTIERLKEIYGLNRTY